MSDNNASNSQEQSCRKTSRALSSADRNSFAKARERAETLAALIDVPKNLNGVKQPTPTNISDEEHHSRLGEHAAALWRYNKITDVTVRLRGVAYPAHKTVLSCYSRYFKNLLLESKGSPSIIDLELESVTNEAFSVLLQYMYTANLNLTCQNIGEVYTASRKLGIEGAQHLCTEILTGKTKREVYPVYIYVTARKLCLDDAAKRALKTMTERFEHIVGTIEFLDLSCDQVIEYLSADILATRSEVIVYLAALKWLSVRYLEREKHATDVISCVRFPSMTLNEILACYSPPLLPGITEIPEVRDLLLKSTCYVASKTVNEEKRFKQYSCPPRQYLIEREATILWDTNIFDAERHALYAEEMAAKTIQAAYRGYQVRKSIHEADSAARTIQKAYRMYSQKSHLSEESSEEREASYIGQPDNGVPFTERFRKSVVGIFRRAIGVDEEQDESRMEDEEHDEKQPKRKVSSTDRLGFMNFKRRGSSSGSSRESVSSLSGQVPQKRNSLDVLSAKRTARKATKQYPSDVGIAEDASLKRSQTVHRIQVYPTDEKENGLQVSEFKRSKSYSPRPSLTDDDILYRAIIVTGGFNSQSVEDDNSGCGMYLYDPALNEWKSIGQMKNPRHHHCMVYLNGFLYCIGGCDPKNTQNGKMVPTQSCFRYDIVNKKWQGVAPMKRCRMYHGVAIVKDKIYIVGGKDETD
ncbi:kelch-like protein 41b, partial [Stegodyphus dumicola]|uniref:kelch-like protein 41b n=1 Tax=Stegodyphus dumicola TaxID=202533 RepID=UPI0015B07710